jgi:hypothetical protein
MIDSHTSTPSPSAAQSHAKFLKGLPPDTLWDALIEEEDGPIELFWQAKAQVSTLKSALAGGMFDTGGEHAMWLLQSALRNLEDFEAGLADALGKVLAPEAEA